MAAEPTTTETTETTATIAGFELTEKPSKVLVAYLTERVSGAADAPHQGFPFIDGKDNVRVKPDDFEQWFLGVDSYTGTPNKKQVRAILKDAGLVQKVYALPAHEAHPELTGKSFGLYTGPAPAGTKTLPRRVVERAVPARKPAAETTPAPETTPAESNPGTERVAASTLKVGDTIGTTRSDSRKALDAGEGTTIAAITASNDGRVQARREDGKMIRSMEPETQVWVKPA